MSAANSPAPNLAAPTDGIPRRKQKGHVLPKQPPISLDTEGRLRTAHLLAIFAISHSSLYSRMRDGRCPLPDGRDGNRLYWNTSSVRQFLGL